MFLALLISCDSKSTDDEKKKNIDFSGDLRQLKINLLQGDTNAYLQLRDFYFQSSDPSNILSWSIIAANKFKSQQARYDVFDCMQSINSHFRSSTGTQNLLDSATNHFSRSFLDTSMGH